MVIFNSYVNLPEGKHRTNVWFYDIFDAPVLWLQPIPAPIGPLDLHSHVFCPAAWY
jgi:hypothetical protein